MTPSGSPPRTEEKGEVEAQPATLGVRDCQEGALGIHPPTAMIPPVNANILILLFRN
jgi:hypothetical protein